MSIEGRILEARELLRALGFGPGRTNDRSARTLVSLLHLEPDQPWSTATNPMLGTHAIMAWIRERYGFDYAPNSRETIRRFTLHQFIEAGLVIYNEDDPSRAVNSKDNNYKVSPEALEIIRGYGSPVFDQRLTEYLLSAPGLREKYGAAREMARIPVTLPGGRPVTLSGGGQNVLLKAMVEDFGERFTPGGRVLYIGDADSKLAVFDEARLARLGVVVDHHGKLPDLVIYLEQRNWLVLLEAASSHGPVDAKRHGELKNLFKGSTAGLVFVSAFPDRATMRRFLGDLAWETEAWAADEPSHLIHLNGERFLGPYA